MLLPLIDTGTHNNWRYFYSLVQSSILNYWYHDHHCTVSPELRCGEGVAATLPKENVILFFNTTSWNLHLLRIKIVFLNPYDGMKTVGGAKIESDFSSTHCLHHIMKVEK